MRIAFLGKGGAGKTTTSAGFIQYLSRKYPFVLAVDADVNAHLLEALQFDSGAEGEFIELGEVAEAVQEYLRGQRSDLGDRMMIGTTPPSLHSNFIGINAEDPFVKKYALKKGNISLLTVGRYKEEDVGASCYHTKLQGTASMFHHMLDGEDEVVVADTTAGTDNVATSLSFAYDINIMVVEPTEKSLAVYTDFVGVAPHLEDRVFVVANKVETPEDEAFIRAAVPDARYLGAIPFSRNLKKFEQGDEDALALFQEEQAKIFDRVLAAWKAQKRDWSAYLKELTSAHSKTCRSWWNDYYGQILDEDLDPDFSYEKAVSQSKAKAPALV